jgi:septum site-determining protein MinD
VIQALSIDFDYILCDSPAGIERGAQLAMYFADEAVLVTNPEVSSVRDTDRIIGLLQAKTQAAKNGGKVKEHLLLTRYNSQRVAEGEMLSLEDVQDILSVPLMGLIPESESVLKASNKGVPVIHEEGSDASIAYKDAVSRLLGEEVPLKFVEPEKTGFLNRMFGGRK